MSDIKRQNRGVDTSSPPPKVHEGNQILNDASIIKKRGANHSLGS